MAKLVWDQVGKRVYESGVDRGVLYLPDGHGIPWNGLTGVEEQGADESEPYYFDGVKYMDQQSIGDYVATLRALTYPDEFMEFEGVDTTDEGLIVGNQGTNRFGLSYRTRVGNDLNGLDFGYKVHILYNLTAVPSEKAYNTLSENSEPSEFSWEIAGVPERVAGYKPTSHAFFDTTRLSKTLVDRLEAVLYGSVSGNANLPSLVDLTAMVRN